MDNWAKTVAILMTFTIKLISQDAVRLSRRPAEVAKEATARHLGTAKIDLSALG